MGDPRRLFVASTPMIALACAAIAAARPGPARLMLIEDFDLAPRLQDLLLRWRDNPFIDIQRLPGRHTEHCLGAGHEHRGLAGLLRRVCVKRALRQRTLLAIRHCEAAHAPEEIWLANDRKPETQLALHLAGRRTGARPGRYIDDGLYTYLGDVRTRTATRRVDAAVKRLAYGRWWQQAPLAGTTRWIAQRWLAFPGDDADRSPARERHALPRAWFLQRRFLRLGAMAAREFGIGRNTLRRAGVVLALPHSNQLRANPALAPALARVVDAQLAQGATVALKYHPRENVADPARLVRPGVTVLPALLPLELLLPLLPAGTRLMGEGSTALLAAHWLRPDLEVLDLGISGGGYAARARAFFATHGIASARLAD
jgi:hypothetical protein